MVGIRAVELGSYERPLLSLKLSEFTDRDAADLDQWSSAHHGRFELFLHAFDHTEVERRLVARAARVYVGNTELFGQLLPLRSDVQELFCPGTILQPQRFMKTDISVFTFGMAHKIRVPLYRRLHELLEAHRPVVLRLRLDGAAREHELRRLVRGDVRRAAVDLRRAGLLHGVTCRIRRCSTTCSTARILAAFFEKGLRANNTTVNAAMECGCTVITNLDGYSPAGLTHMANVVDINQCDRLPTPEESERIGRAARKVALGRYGWDQLVGQLRAVAPVK